MVCGIESSSYHQYGPLKAGTRIYGSLLRHGPQLPLNDGSNTEDH